MTKLLKILSSVWLAAALVVVPFPAFSIQTNANDPAPCPSHMNADAGLHAGVDMPASSHCKHCDEHPCTSDDCSAGGCSVFHQQTGSVAVLGISLQIRSVSIDSMLVRYLPTRSDPPLLPPPV